ncbi:MAG TPA: hypothetical protein VI548_00195 [Chitinophagaceae bacterium]|nr:hypothetical protein [Chitinophagaceae bacterium]
MFKIILLALLAVFFILNGFNHFYNKKLLEEYAHKRHLFSPKLSVFAAGGLLVAGGVCLLIPDLLIAGVISLSVFLFVAAFTIHTFWVETGKQEKLIEAMNFAKNMAILTELLYIGFA